MLKKINGSVVCVPKRVAIGSAYTSRRQFHADSVGNYWESLPDIGSHGEKLQKALLKKSKPVKVKIQQENF